MGVSADGSSNALQSWDMLHGNVLLRGWTTTDVPFYTNELIHFMAVELVTGLHSEVVNLGVALTFVLLVIVVAVAAGPSWWGKLLAVAVVGVPAMGIGTSVQLTSPDHTGTAIPLLLTWIVLDRFADRRWVPWAVAGMLAWGQLSDPLVMYIGALPLAVVCALRMVRDRTWWGVDAQLILAAFGSVVLNQAAQLAIRAGGGWAAHPPTVEFASWERLFGHNLSLTLRGIVGNFGGYLPDRENEWRLAMGVVHLGLLALAVVTTVLVLWRLVRRRRGEPGDRLAELAAVGIGVNIGAYLVSTLPLDMGTSRQIIAVVPLSAALVGRVWGARLGLATRPQWRLAALGVAGLLALELAVQAVAYPKATNGRDIAAWLDSQGLRQGLGSYWYSNNITLLTAGRVKVFPVVGGDRIRGYRSESKLDWYDPAVHDARFIVVDTKNWPGDVDVALRQFGSPVRQQVLPTATILVYDRNLLVGLPAHCVPEEAPSMAACPPHRDPLFG